MRGLASVLVLASLLATAAADDDVAKARAFFDGDPADERSATRRFHDFLALDSFAVRAALSDAWELRRHDPRFENLLRFLHGVEPRLLTTRTGREEWAIVGGAVVWWNTAAGWGRNGGTDHVEESPYERLFGSTPLLAVPLPKAADLLAFAWDDPKKLPPSGRDDFAMALGEACVDDDAAFAELARRFDAAPDDPFLVTAIGWTRRPAAKERLLVRAKRIAPGTGDVDSRIVLDVRTTLRALRHVSPADFERLLNERSVSEADRMAACLSDEVLVERRLAALRDAVGPVARREALRRFCDVEAMRAAGRYDGRPPAGDSARRFLEETLDAVESDDADLRADAVRMFQWFWSPGGWSRFVRGEVELKRLVEDVRASRLAFRRVGLWEETAPLQEITLQSEPKVSVSATAAWEFDGLHVHLRNVGTAALSINATALRHACTAEFSPDGTLDVALGRRGDGLTSSPAAYDASCLVPLPPRTEREFVVPLDEKARNFRHVRLAIEPTTVLGKSSAPVLWFQARTVL